MSFYLGVAWRLAWIHPRPDRVVALTTPPYLSVLARLVTKLRGAYHAHWVMDLYPDVMVAHGMLSPGKMAHRALAALARWGMGGRRCAAVITLGPDMARRIRHLLGTCRDDLISWIPLWGGTACPQVEPGLALEDPARVLRRQRGWQDDELVVMYSGNMGLGHRFDEIFKVIRDGCGEANPENPSRGTNAWRRKSSAGKPVRFAFFGGGKRRGEIEEFMTANPGCAMELHDYVPAESLAEHLRSADLHLVTLEPKWTGTMLPSKLQGIFAVGRPVVFIGDSNSSIAMWIKESGGGWVVPPQDCQTLARVMDEACNESIRGQRGLAALAYAQVHFDRNSNQRKVAKALLADSITK
jgi:hypothetical protein